MHQVNSPSFGQQHAQPSWQQAFYTQQQDYPGLPPASFTHQQQQASNSYNQQQQQAASSASRPRAQKPALLVPKKQQSSRGAGRGSRSGSSGRM